MLSQRPQPNIPRSPNDNHNNHDNCPSDSNPSNDSRPNSTPSTSPPRTPSPLVRPSFIGTTSNDTQRLRFPDLDSPPESPNSWLTYRGRGDPHSVGRSVSSIEKKQQERQNRIQEDSGFWEIVNSDRSTRITVAMMFLFGCLLFYVIFISDETAVSATASHGGPAGLKSANYRRMACPDYKDYSARAHAPYSTGTYQLPFQRPAEECRLFKSQAVEDVITGMTARMKDPDLARLFENCFPNTLDTTVRWHDNAEKVMDKQSFIVTGDINAQWLRDSTNQLSQYQLLVTKDEGLKNLILGAIQTQAKFVIQSPYCNAFQPPKDSGLSPTSNGQADTVHPTYDNTIVFECKYEVDSLASFLSLGNQYYSHTSDTSFVTNNWLRAVRILLKVVDEQSVSTFAPDGTVQNQVYTFQRQTSAGTETLNLGGIGNPIAANTSLVRSAFRPSDDAAIMQYFVPGNAFLSVELQRTAEVLDKLKQKALADRLRTKGKEIAAGIWKYGVVQHAVFGKVFAYEVDGYGSHIIMDDANLPSLLSLPLLGFVDRDDPVYQNTRKMILSPEGNPYYLEGTQFSGIGGPHIGITHAWPMSLLVQAMTSDDDKEIVELLKQVLVVSKGLGLIHESVNVERVADYTRSWFAWANSVFAQTILDLAKRKPHLIFDTKKEV
ncbi:hypothetical protein RUND412_007896 [Rhizina undulata]